VRKRIASRGEKEAWTQLRTLREEGFAFRREHKLGRYWADFVCLRKKLIVEVDGPLHERAEAQAHDAGRDRWLCAEGFVVMRFKEAEILSSAYWLGEVRAVLQSRPDFDYRQRRSLHPNRISPHPLTPSPSRGGESERP
jgi:very-short-patch-repair endonuclease